MLLASRDLASNLHIEGFEQQNNGSGGEGSGANTTRLGGQPLERHQPAIDGVIES